MARFTRAQLESFNGALVDDLVGGRVRLLFVGINPGLWTAAVNAHFARRGNRFWPALHAAGITPYEVDASDGMRADDLAMLAALGVGITNIVPTASARADELTRAELRAGGAALATKVSALRPNVVAVLGPHAAAANRPGQYPKRSEPSPGPAMSPGLAISRRWGAASCVARSATTFAWA